MNGARNPRDGGGLSGAAKTQRAIQSCTGGTILTFGGRAGDLDDFSSERHLGALRNVPGCADASAVGRTFVKSTGSDSNTASNCGPTTPCRSFAAALTVTDSGGEVVVLDSAGYGPTPINITQSVSITAPDGVYAGIAVGTGDGVLINGTGIAVSLQGLRINGTGGANGINFAAGSKLHIRNCIVSNMTTNGIQVTAASANVFIDDVEVRDNGQSGILLSGAMTAVRRRECVRRVRHVGSTG
jgi:hypothetical protein